MKVLPFEMAETSIHNNCSCNRGDQCLQNAGLITQQKDYSDVYEPRDLLIVATKDGEFHVVNPEAQEKDPLKITVTWNDLVSNEETTHLSPPL
eukprot:m.347845 g.347845  ORF g.347845 m.347845 type:complete len:93 (+) comp34342_c0_seq1:313-591(+)